MPIRVQFRRCSEIQKGARLDEHCFSLGPVPCFDSASFRRACSPFPGGISAAAGQRARSGPRFRTVRAFHYKEVAGEIAKLGYDVVLFDGNKEENTHGVQVKADIQTAIGMPHAMPGKVALVGFSLGGGEEMFYGTGPMSAEQVAVGIFWYPANAFIKDLNGFANRLSMPVFVFAGGKDHFRNGCCTAAHDGELQDASKAANKMFNLVVYPDADHDFVKGGDHYNGKDYSDALMHTADILKMYLSN